MSTYVRPAVDYSTFPDSDDEPMADTEDNQALMIDTIFALRHRLEPEGHHVGGNLLVYYNPANGLDHLSPDVFVALGSGPARRKKWETWIEGKFPEIIVEFASPSTSDRDVGEKVDLYGRLGAQEYYIFDPIPLLQPPFQAYRRSGPRLVAQPVGPEQQIASPVTGLIFGVVDGWLRVIDPATGVPLRIPDEEREARIAAELRWEAAERARDAAEQGRLAAERARGAAEERTREEERARGAAEERARQEERARGAAEERAWQEERARGAAEERARQEERARVAADARIAALEAQLRSLQEQGGQSGAGGAGT